MTDPPRLSLQICPYAIPRGTAKAFLSFLYELLGAYFKQNARAPRESGHFAIHNTELPYTIFNTCNIKT